MIDIYCLINPENDCVFYVGATLNAKNRYSQHCADKSDSYKCSIISKLKDVGIDPEMLILESVDDELASVTETFYMHLFRMYGFYLPQRDSYYTPKGNPLSNAISVRLDFEIERWIYDLAARENRTRNNMINKILFDCKKQMESV